MVVTFRGSSERNSGVHFLGGIQSVQSLQVINSQVSLSPFEVCNFPTLVYDFLHLCQMWISMDQQNIIMNFAVCQ